MGKEVATMRRAIAVCVGVGGVLLSISGCEGWNLLWGPTGDDDTVAEGDCVIPVEAFDPCDGDLGSAPEGMVEPCDAYWRECADSILVCALPEPGTPLCTTTCDDDGDCQLLGSPYEGSCDGNGWCVPW